MLFHALCYFDLELPNVSGRYAVEVSLYEQMNNIVVQERFAVPSPTSIRLQDAAPLLCAGIATYSPIVKASIKMGDKVG